MAVQFTNPGTALVYETDFVVDVFIYVGCSCNGGKGYKGHLSDLPPMAALALEEQGSNLVKRKPLPSDNSSSGLS